MKKLYVGLEENERGEIQLWKNPGGKVQVYDDPANMKRALAHHGGLGDELRVAVVSLNLEKMWHGSGEGWDE